jgi:hypothetical protein
MAKADIRAFRNIGHCGLIVLKNSKNLPSHFSANFRCVGKVGPICVSRVVRDAHIAKALIWSSPRPKSSTGALWRSFSPFLTKNRVFQQNRLSAVIRRAKHQWPQSGEPAVRYARLGCLSCGLFRRSLHLQSDQRFFSAPDWRVTQVLIAQYQKTAAVSAPAWSGSKPAVFAAEMNALRAAPTGARQCIAASIWARAKFLSWLETGHFLRSQ